MPTIEGKPPDGRPNATRSRSRYRVYQRPGRSARLVGIDERKVDGRVKVKTTGRKPILADGAARDECELVIVQIVDYHIAELLWEDGRHSSCLVPHAN